MPHLSLRSGDPYRSLSFASLEIHTRLLSTAILYPRYVWYGVWPHLLRRVEDDTKGYVAVCCLDWDIPEEHKTDGLGHIWRTLSFLLLGSCDRKDGFVPKWPRFLMAHEADHDTSPDEDGVLPGKQEMSHSRTEGVAGDGTSSASGTGSQTREDMEFLWGWSSLPPQTLQWLGLRTCRALSASGPSSHTSVTEHDYERAFNLARN